MFNFFSVSSLPNHCDGVLGGGLVDELLDDEDELTLLEDDSHQGLVEDVFSDDWL